MTLIAALAGALAISFSGIFFGLSGVDPITGAFFRVAYALPVLFVIWFLFRDRDHRTLQKRLLAFGSGFLLGVDMVVWHTSIGYIGAGLATLIANTQVVFVALGGWLILKERPSQRILIAIPIVLVGVAMVSGLGQSDAFGSDPLLGTALALVSAMFYAAFILVFRASNDIQAPPAGPLMEATAGGLLTILVFGHLRRRHRLRPHLPGARMADRGRPWRPGRWVAPDRLRPPPAPRGGDRDHHPGATGVDHDLGLHDLRRTTFDAAAGRSCSRARRRRVRRRGTGPGSSGADALDGVIRPP